MSSAAHNPVPNAVEQALTNPDPQTRCEAVRRHELSDAQLDRALGDPDPAVRAAAIYNHPLTPEQLEQALTDTYSAVREAAACKPGLNTPQLDRALTDDDVYVRFVAALRANLTAAQLEQALTDDDVYVRRAAIRHSNLNTRQLERALTDTNSAVRADAARDYHLTRQQHERALNDTYSAVRSAATKHNNPRRHPINEPTDTADVGDALPDRYRADPEWDERQTAELAVQIARDPATTGSNTDELAEYVDNLRKQALEAAHQLRAPHTDNPAPASASNGKPDITHRLTASLATLIARDPTATHLNNNQIVDLVLDLNDLARNAAAQLRNETSDPT